MLTGDLSDFSLREILQFLATTRVSGMLELRGDEPPAGVALREGGVCLALLDVGGIAGLAARLLHAGVIDVDRLRTVGERADADGVALAARLARDTSDRSVTARLCQEHTEETLGWLVSRETGTFQFERSTEHNDWPFGTVTVDRALADIDARARDWDDIRDMVSDLTLLASAVPNPEDIDDISLDAAQWRMITLVDGRRPLRELIELSGLGHLETCRHLHALVAAGLIELVDPAQQSTLATVLGGLHAVGARTAHATPPVTAAELSVSTAPVAQRAVSDDAQTPGVHAAAAPPAERVAFGPVAAPPPSTDTVHDTSTPEAAREAADTSSGDPNQSMLARLLRRPEAAS